LLLIVDGQANAVLEEFEELQLGHLRNILPWLKN